MSIVVYRGVKNSLTDSDRSVSSASCRKTGYSECMVRRRTARGKLGREDKSGANVFVNKGEDVVRDKDILPVASSNARSQRLETRVRADPSVESSWVERSPPSINSVTTTTMIAYSDTQSLLGARAPTQPDGLACADQNTFQATLDERTCGYGICVRSIQYIRIASLRAVATLATVKCF
jgi:hypothetical protein